MPRIFGRQKKTSLFLILSLLILTVAVGGTIAYIVRVSTVPTNTFVPVEVDSEPVSTSSGIAVRNNGEIEAYIATGEPLGVAGSFTIDGYGGPFIDRIEGDPHGVTGLSLPLLRELMAQSGLSITELWDGS